MSTVAEKCAYVFPLIKTVEIRYKQEVLYFGSIPMVPIKYANCPIKDWTLIDSPSSNKTIIVLSLDIECIAE